MRRILLFAAVLLGLAAGTANAIPNPYKCGALSPASCARMNAEKLSAAAAKLRLPNTAWMVNMYCTPANARMRVWNCTWGSVAGTTGAATVTFYGTRNGWRAKLTNLRATP